MLVAVKKSAGSRPPPSKAPEADASALAPRPEAAALASLQRQNALLKAQIAALRNSMSWQVTSPLRFIGQLLHPKQD
jgi:hypothetical protein